MHFIVAATLTAAACLPAQEPQPQRATTPGNLPFPTETVFTDHAPDGTVWAMAGTWKAEFAASGTTFVPFLGSTVASAPATFHVGEVTCGGVHLAVTAAEPQLADRRVQFQRGGLVEFYDLTPEGIEQQFAFTTLPARGELRVALEVGTDLAAEPDGAGLYFRGPHGGIRYGEAVAIDATGARCAVACERTGDGLQLVVPEWFVAKACLPLRIDPMIGSSTPFGAGTTVLSSPDLVYDVSLGVYCVAYEHAFSATDHDVFAARLDTLMNLLSVSPIDITVQSWSRPRVAALGAHDQACFVAEVSTGTSTSIRLGIRRFDLASTSNSHSQATLNAGLGGDYLEPVIGGDSGENSSVSSLYLIASTFRNASTNDKSITVWGYYHNDGIVPVAPPTPARSIERTPTLSKVCGDHNAVGANDTASWAIVYRSEDPGNGTGQLRVAICDRHSVSLRSFGGSNSFALGGSVIGLGSQWAVSSPTDHQLGRRFLCVERPASLFQANAPLVGHLFDRTGAILHSNAALATSVTDNRQPTVDSDGIRFAVAHTIRLSATDADLRCATFGVLGNQLAMQDVAWPSFSLDYDAQPALCATRGALRGRYGLAFVRSSGNNHAVRTQGYLGIAASGGMTTRGTGCGGLASTSTGLAELGHAVTVSLADPSGLPGFLVGLPTNSPVAGCPGCSQGVTGQALLGGQVTVAIPPNAAFVGITLSAQGFRFVPSGAPCLGQIQIGNTHDFTIR